MALASRDSLPSRSRSGEQGAPPPSLASVSGASPCKRSLLGSSPLLLPAACRLTAVDSAASELDSATTTATASAKDTESPACCPTAVASIARAQEQAQAHLLSAIASERSKRWCEAIEYYRKLLDCLSKKKFPSEYMPGPRCAKLVFETYYHIGVALQNLDCHHEASEEFTNAIEAVNIPKNICQVGCVSSSFCQTPVLARRAYSYVKCDNIKKAVSDATRAVYLDPLNPDVYCVRALVWSSAKEKRRALIDLNVSFKLNSSHVCTLIIRGAILNSLGGVPSSQENKDHEKILVAFECFSHHNKNKLV